MNINWNADISSVTKGSKLFEPFDIELYESKIEAFNNLSNSEKSHFKGADDFVAKNGGPNLSPLNVNYKKLYAEVEKRLDSESVPELLSIDFLMQSKLIQDLLCSLENEKYIKDIYPTKKLMVKAGLNISESKVLMECIRQGRSLLQAGKDAEMLAKPLIHFYAASAYAYAIIVINSPLHNSIDSLKGSHGHIYNHSSSTIDFGGDIPIGTFIDLLGAIPTIHIKNQHIDLKYPLLDSIELVQNNRISFSLLSLLSMVPELGRFYSLYDRDEKHRIIHKISIDTEVVNTRVKYNFYIGDGIHKPNIYNLKKVFKTDQIVENQGSFHVSVTDIKSISPTIYQDVKGNLWYIESPIDGLVLPEISLHFLIISALSNIMRYSPHEWSNVLNNKVSSQFSLLISEYLRLFEQKFPMLVVQYLTNYIPVLDIISE